RRIESRQAMLLLAAPSVKIEAALSAAQFRWSASAKASKEQTSAAGQSQFSSRARWSAASHFHFARRLDRNRVLAKWSAIRRSSRRGSRAFSRAQEFD